MAKPSNTATTRARPDRQQFAAALSANPPSHHIPEINLKEAEAFTHDLSLALNICSVQNVKACVDFIVSHIFPSQRRTVQLMTYLVDCGKSFQPDRTQVTSASTDDRGVFAGLGAPSAFRELHPPSPQSQRLHALCIIDAALKTRLHQRLPVQDTLIKRQILPHLLSLLRLASFSDAYSTDASSNGLTALQNMITTWEKINATVLDQSEIVSLRTAVVLGNNAASWRAVLRGLETQESNEAQLHPFASEPEWIIPMRHDNPGHYRAPEHALPAANGLFMKRYNGWPMKSRGLPEGGYNLYRGGTQPDDRLIEQVEQLYVRALQCHDKHTPDGEIQDVDALGNKICRNMQTTMSTHWGWSIDGIAKRKELAERFRANAIGYAGVHINPLPTPSRQPSSSARFGAQGAPRNAPKTDLRNDIARARGLANKAGSRQFGQDEHFSQ